MNIFLENGYCDIKSILSEPYSFIWIIGGRGTGKTYTTLKTVYEEKIKFMFLRRNQNQIDKVANPAMMPFKKLNEDNGWNVTIAPVVKDVYGAYESDIEDGKLKPKGTPLGLFSALSTFANLRGFDGSDIKLLIWDEFIPQIGERPLKSEAEAFLNAYETINRNRELEGEEPLKFIGLSNSNTVASDTFLYLGLTPVIEKMRQKGMRVWKNEKRSTLIVDLGESEISEKKKQTVLYQMAVGTEYSGMALENDFVSDDFSNIVSRPIKEYYPYAFIGELCIYHHKSKSEWYVCQLAMGTPRFFYPDTAAGKEKFRRDHLSMVDHFLARKIYFKDFYCKKSLTKLLGLANI